MGDAVLARVRALTPPRPDPMCGPGSWPAFYAEEIQIVCAFVRADLVTRWPFPTVPAQPFDVARLPLSANRRALLEKRLAYYAETDGPHRGRSTP